MKIESVRDYLVAIVDERADARVAVMVVESHDTGVVDDICDAEGPGTVVADRVFVPLGYWQGLTDMRAVSSTAN